MPDFEFLLFSADPVFAAQAVDAGVHGIVIDWEFQDKHRRQRGADTQINRHTLADLHAVRKATAARIIVRLNRLGAHTPRELHLALDGGADEVLLPMVEGAAEVERLLTLARDRIHVGILVETLAAVEAAPQLARFPLRRVYVGLNDLAIQRRSPTIFAPLADGTLDRIRTAFDVPFGFAGLTLPDRGDPIPCRLLMAELARLHASFSFLRRSFTADVPPQQLGTAMSHIRHALKAMARRTPIQVAADRAALLQAIHAGEAPLRHTGRPTVTRHAAPASTPD